MNIYGYINAFDRIVLSENLEPVIKGCDFTDYIKVNIPEIKQDQYYNLYDILSIIKNRCDAYKFKYSPKLLWACNIFANTFKDAKSSKTAEDMIEITVNYFKTQLDTFNHEKTLYDLIKKDINILIPGATIIEFDIKNRKIPDFIVTINDEIVPIEVKSGEIDNSAIRQIKNYMRIYECEKGIVMGSALKNPLRNLNIRFVSISHLHGDFFL